MNNVWTIAILPVYFLLDRALAILDNYIRCKYQNKNIEKNPIGFGK